MARRLGATEAELDGVAAGAYDAFTEERSAALAMADAMTTTGSVVPDDLYARLRARWSDPAIVEIVAVIALFNYFNRFAIALDIPVTR